MGNFAAFDPAKEYYQLSFEILKCCLARTLYATNGKPVDEGGAELRPDIALAQKHLGWSPQTALRSRIRQHPFGCAC